MISRVLKAIFGSRNDRLLKGYSKTVREINALEPSIAALTAAGRPSLMVPLPNSIDDHQIANARAIEERGGGWVLLQGNFAPAAIAERLTTIFAQPDRLEQVAAAARALGRRDAAERLAEVVTGLVAVDGQPDLRRGIA